MKPIRVLVVGQTPPPFHGQAVMIKLLVEGNYRDIEIIYVPTNFSRDLEGSGKFQLLKLWGLVRVVVNVYGAALRRRPSVLYYPTSGGGLMPVAKDIFNLGLTRWLFKATVLHFHASGVSEYLRTLPTLMRKLFQVALAAPELVIRISPKSPQDGIAVGARREVIVPNGIPDAAGGPIVRSKLKRDPLKILFVGGLREDKGVLVAIQSVQELLRSGLDVDLTCLGEWVSPEFQRQAVGLVEEKFQSCFHFPGVVTGDDKWRFYRDADIFFFPTFYRSETFPVVLLEAMSFSLPIVSTNWRGIPDVVEEGHCAFLCEPQRIDCCTRALAKLISDSSLREEMGRHSRERFIANFTIDVYLQGMERALASLREA